MEIPSSAQGLLEIFGRNDFFSSFAKEWCLHFVNVKIPDAVMKTGNPTNTKVIYTRLFCLLAISISVILVSGTFMSELVTCPRRNTLAATKWCAIGFFLHQRKKLRLSNIKLFPSQFCSRSIDFFHMLIPVAWSYVVNHMELFQTVMGKVATANIPPRSKWLS